jgi:enoyl-CoA hydratase/carnithine racemase
VIDDQLVMDFGVVINELEGLANRGEIAAVVLTSLKKAGFCHGADVDFVVRNRTCPNPLNAVRTYRCPSLQCCVFHSTACILY